LEMEHLRLEDMYENLKQEDKLLEAIQIGKSMEELRQKFVPREKIEGWSKRAPDSHLTIKQMESKLREQLDESKVSSFNEQIGKKFLPAVAFQDLEKALKMQKLAVSLMESLLNENNQIESEEVKKTEEDVKKTEEEKWKKEAKQRKKKRDHESPEIIQTQNLKASSEKPEINTPSPELKRGHKPRKGSLEGKKVEKLSKADKVSRSWKEGKDKHRASINMGDFFKTQNEENKSKTNAPSSAEVPPSLKRQQSLSSIASLKKSSEKTNPSDTTLKNSS